MSVAIAKQMSLGGFTKCRIKINVSDAVKNLVPDFWTADG